MTLLRAGLAAAVLLIGSSGCTPDGDDPRTDPSPATVTPSVTAADTGVCATLDLARVATPMDMTQPRRPIESVSGDGRKATYSCLVSYDGDGPVAQAQMTLLVEQYADAGDLDTQWDFVEELAGGLGRAPAEGGTVRIDVRRPDGSWDESLATGAVRRYDPPASAPDVQPSIDQLFLTTWVRIGTTFVEVRLQREEAFGGDREAALAEMGAATSLVLAEVR